MSTEHQSGGIAGYLKKYESENPSVEDTADIRHSLKSFNELVASAFSKKEDAPRTIIFGPRYARILLKLAEMPPSDEAQPRSQRGNAHQRRIVRRQRQSGWERIKWMATLPEDDPARMAIRA